MSSIINSDFRNPKSKLTSPKIVLSFMVIQFLAFFYYGGFRAVFPFILENLGYSEIQVVESWAFIFSFGLLIGFFTRMPMGIVVDKISRRNSLILGTVICSVSISFLFLTSDVLILALVFGAIRTGTHIFPLITRGFSNEVVEKRQGRINGFMLLAANIAGFLSPIVLTYALNVSFTVLIIFSIIVLYGVLGFLLLVVPKKSVRKEFAMTQIFLKSLSELSRFRNAILVLILVGLINGTFNYMQVPYARYVLDLPQAEVSIIIGLVSLSNIIFILFSGELINRVGIRNMIYLGLGLILLGTSIIVTNPLSVIPFIIGQMFVGGGILFNINSTVTLVTIRSSMETASTSFGAVSSFFFLGSSLIPFIAKELYIIQEILPFYFIIILTLTFYIIILFLNIQKRKNSKEIST